MAVTILAAAVGALAGFVAGAVVGALRTTRHARLEFFPEGAVRVTTHSLEFGRWFQLEHTSRRTIRPGGVRP